MINNFFVGSALFISGTTQLSWLIKDYLSGAHWGFLVIGISATIVWFVCFIEFVRFYELKRK